MRRADHHDPMDWRGGCAQRRKGAARDRPRVHIAGVRRDQRLGRTTDARAARCAEEALDQGPQATRIRGIEPAGHGGPPNSHPSPPRLRASGAKPT